MVNNKGIKLFKCLQVQKSKISIQKKIILSIILSFMVFFLLNDVLFAQTNNSDMQEKYINILEKTNQQLSLYWTPYNTIITILTALFAILAIIFGFFIYIQSKEYKERLTEDKKRYAEKIDKFLKEHQRYAKKLMDERNAKIKGIESNLSKTVLEYEKKLEVLLKTPKKQKYKIEEIEKAIEKLKTEKELLKSQIGAITVTPEYNYPSAISAFGGSNFHKCSHCGFGFKIEGYDRNDRMTAISTIGNATVTCPKCGNVDPI